MDNSYIKIYRKIFESEIFIKKPAEWFKIWLWILWNVNFKEKNLPPGSIFIRYSQIASECHVTYNQVDKAIKSMERAKMLATQKATHWIILSVCNWSDYQGDSLKPKATKKATTEPRPSETEAIIYKEEGKKEEGNNISSTLVIDDPKKIRAEFLASLRKSVWVDKFKDEFEWKEAWLCFTLMEKIGKEDFLSRLKWVLRDAFKAKNCNRLSYLRKEIESFIHSPIVQPTNDKQSHVDFSWA